MSQRAGDCVRVGIRMRAKKTGSKNEPVSPLLIQAFGSDLLTRGVVDLLEATI